jgi:hypothetical protein
MMRHSLMAATAALLLSGGDVLAQSGQAPAYPMPPPEPILTMTPGGHEVPAAITTDRHTRCMQYAASIGVPHDKIDGYLKRCVLQ